MGGVTPGAVRFCSSATRPRFQGIEVLVLNAQYFSGPLGSSSATAVCTVTELLGSLRPKVYVYCVPPLVLNR
ncbi:MAG: hypothetical protein ABSH32_16020 [Bryobacteraceae bacterium]|jgi:hypothetical protein